MSELLFKLNGWDDTKFILKPCAMDALKYSYLYARIQGCPEKKFSVQLDAWLIPQTENVIQYILETFDPGEYEIDAYVATVISYHTKTHQLQAIKAKRRWAYTFEGKVPEIKFKDYKTEPYKHQVVGLDALHNAEYFGLLMEMGTGKTKIVIDEICWQGKGKWLIVCPKTVIGTWIREFEKHASKPYFIARIRSHWRGVRTLVDGMQDDRAIKIWVLNYERIKPQLEALKKMNFDGIVADESTHIKNPSTSRTKALLELGETAKRRIIMTGTPAGNTLMDLFSQFEFLQRGALGYSNFAQFKLHYAKFKTIAKGIEKLVGYKKIDELKARMAACSFVVKKKDCLDLPDKVYVTRDVEMGEVQQRLYNQMLSIALADLEGNMDASSVVQATIVLVQLLRLSQISSGYLKTMDGTIRKIPGGDVKLKAVKDIVSSVDTESKIVIWSRFIHDIDETCDMLEKEGISYGRITGKESDKVREANIVSFSEDTGIRVIVGNPATGGLGITLIGSENRPCSTVVYFANDFNMLKRSQSEDRSHRIGVKQPVTYIDLLCEGTIDERILKILRNKMELNQSIQNFESIKELLLGPSKEMPTIVKQKRVEVPEWVTEQLAMSG